jgi:hypothetical protein
VTISAASTPELMRKDWKRDIEYVSDWEIREYREIL